MIDFFKPEDFGGPFPGYCREELAYMANRKLEKALGPEVYGCVGTEASSWISDKPGQFLQNRISHTARLFNIQPIKKKCEHEHVLVSVFGVGQCSTCGKTLIAKWEEPSE